MRSLARLDLTRYLPPTVDHEPDVWAVQGAEHLACLRRVRETTRTLIALMPSARASSAEIDAALEALGRALDACAALDRTPGTPATYDAQEGRALVDLADMAKRLLPQLRALYRQRRVDQRAWVDRVEATLDEAWRLCG